MANNLDIEIQGLAILAFCIKRSNLNRSEAIENFLNFPIEIKKQIFIDLKNENIKTIKDFFNIVYGTK
tara:strand:+ start:195 stop:398 length:204 start_codon:yes stop_codon:yes gene_type:complete